MSEGRRARGFTTAILHNDRDAPIEHGALHKPLHLSVAYAYQDAEITRDQSATVLDGARLAAVPENSFSLWNRYDFTPMWGVGVGVIRKDENFAQTENVDLTVT